MGRSIALAAYLAWSARAETFGNRKLSERLAAQKEDPDRIGERRGIASQPRPEGRLIWFHAASVGESLSILELIRRMGEEDDTLSFLVTTGTVTSAQVMAARLPENAIHQFIPIDVLPWVSAFLDHWKPDLAVWTESEFWPALMHETHRRSVPMVLINARMSQESFRKWRWLKGAARSLIQRFAAAQAQDAKTAEALAKLGLPPDRIEVTGTLKEGSAALPFEPYEHADLVAKLNGRPCWLAASTHPGEEELVLAAHRQAMRGSHRLLLVLVPRHPERSAEVAEMVKATGLRLAIRSADDPLTAETQVYLADTLGEMGLWYRLCPISFVGGSLVEIGGHNPFEPAALGSAILHGPHTVNFKDIYERLATAGATRMVTNSSELAEGITRVLAPDEAARMAHAAWEVCSAGAEVTDKAMALLFEHLDRVA